MSALQPSITGETICYRTHPHWMVLAWPMMLGILFALPWLVNVVISFIMEDTLEPAPSGWVTGLVMPGTAGLLWLAALLHYLASSFVITNRRVIADHRLRKGTRINTWFRDIRSIDVSQGWAGRLMGYGSITVKGAKRAEKFFYVPDPLEFKQRILEQRKLALARPQQIAAA